MPHQATLTRSELEERLARLVELARGPLVVLRFCPGNKFLRFVGDGTVSRSTIRTLESRGYLRRLDRPGQVYQVVRDDG